MSAVVLTARVLRSARRGIGSANGQFVLLHSAASHVVKMSVMQVVHMAVVFDTRVSTIRTVLVGVVGVRVHCSR